MTIALVRHFRVLAEWPSRCGAREFDAACRAYHEAPVELPAGPARLPPGFPVRARYLASGLARAQATARHLFPGVELGIDPRLNEVDLRSHSDSERPRPVASWMLWGRVQWAFNHRRQHETRRDTTRRARSLLDDLEAAGEDCVLVGHGFMNQRLMRELRRRGFSGRVVSRMSNGQILIFRR
jgi:broad specificity phosphatase PhoE